MQQMGIFAISTANFEIRAKLQQNCKKLRFSAKSIAGAPILPLLVRPRYPRTDYRQKDYYPQNQINLELLFTPPCFYKSCFGVTGNKNVICKSGCNQASLLGVFAVRHGICLTEFASS
mmetsp:Transcript_21046/g.34363  ORF Transcript_21046/g.34363 Transcript_21046/m.34363 type:complete len:118 (+) Transcript_21046:3234-3587(+)